MPSKVIIIVIDFMFAGINMFWALLGAHFNPHLSARAKMSLSESGPKHIYAGEQLYCFIKRELRANVRFLTLMNASSRYWSSIHANECVFSRNEQQQV